ncbi:MAG TPA: hypothetical protein VF916_15905 [Ktedonobacterales bacterium]|jgi:hypothetical protein
MPDDTRREWPMYEEIEWTTEDEAAANRALEKRLMREEQARKARRMRESQRPRRRSFWRGAPS